MDRKNKKSFKDVSKIIKRYTKLNTDPSQVSPLYSMQFDLSTTNTAIELFTPSMDSIPQYVKEIGSIFKNIKLIKNNQKFIDENKLFCEHFDNLLCLSVSFLKGEPINSLYAALETVDYFPEEMLGGKKKISLDYLFRSLAFEFLRLFTTDVFVNEDEINFRDGFYFNKISFLSIEEMREALENQIHSTDLTSKRLTGARARIIFIQSFTSFLIEANSVLRKNQFDSVKDIDLDEKLSDFKGKISTATQKLRMMKKIVNEDESLRHGRGEDLAFYNRKIPSSTFTIPEKRTQLGIKESLDYLENSFEATLNTLLCKKIDNLNNAFLLFEFHCFQNIPILPRAILSKQLSIKSFLDIDKLIEQSITSTCGEKDFNLIDRNLKKEISIAFLKILKSFLKTPSSLLETLIRKNLITDFIAMCRYFETLSTCLHQWAKIHCDKLNSIYFSLCFKLKLISKNEPFWLLNFFGRTIFECYSKKILIKSAKKIIKQHNHKEKLNFCTKELFWWRIIKKLNLVKHFIVEGVAQIILVSLKNEILEEKIGMSSAVKLFYGRTLVLDGFYCIDYLLQGRVLYNRFGVSFNDEKKHFTFKNIDEKSLKRSAKDAFHNAFINSSFDKESCTSYLQSNNVDFIIEQLSQLRKISNDYFNFLNNLQIGECIEVKFEGEMFPKFIAVSKEK